MPEKQGVPIATQAHYFYCLAPLKLPLERLTYHYDAPIDIGSVVTLPLGTRYIEGVVLAVTDAPNFATLALQAPTQQYYTPSHLTFAAFIATYYCCALGEALALFTPLQRNACISTTPPPASCRITLSTSQRAAWQFLKQHPVSLLFGDTGSGKTEIYMYGFAEVIKAGKKALFLMPEISLTPQMFHRLEAHFPQRVIHWHSKLTKKQKAHQLQKLHCGDYDIIAGARSALFLHHDNLGLIVVDEEHDDSYKSASRPRYHARDFAVYMGKKLHVNVLLGSATPSLSSYVKFPHYRLKGSHFDGSRRYVFEAHGPAVTPYIISKLQENLAHAQQAIMFLPTRANFKYLICDACGFTYECPYCSVGMSLHKNHRLVKCHYCNFTETVPQICPKCRSSALSHSRLGTAEALAQIQRAISHLRVAQFDRDVVTTQKKLTTLLNSFNEGKIDLLIGTQMLSKGHDYHNISLAVIVGMDHLLQLSDYRARERALSLLIQISGRSGRKKEALVVIQSFHEQFFRPYLDNYEQFLEDEKLLRASLYPPYKKLARLLFAHKNVEKAKHAMHDVVSKLRPFSEVEVVGFGPAPIEKIASKFRFQILLRSEKATDLIRVIQASKHPLCEVDMDPITFT